MLSLAVFGSRLTVPSRLEACHRRITFASIFCLTIGFHSGNKRGLMAPNSARDHIGRRLHSWRIRKNLTLGKAAQLLKVSAPTILRWEKGRVTPNDRMRYRINQALAGRRI